LHRRLLDEAPLAKAKCSSLCAPFDKDVTLDDEDYYCVGNHKAASNFFGQRLFRPEYRARHFAVSDVRLCRHPRRRPMGWTPLWLFASLHVVITSL
jgi:hypothetical protein